MISAPANKKQSKIQLCYGFLRSACHTGTQSILRMSDQLHFPSAKSIYASTSWHPATAEILFIHQILLHNTLTRQLLLIPAQISLSWNWVRFKKFIILKRASDAKTMPFISLGKETARK